MFLVGGLSKGAALRGECVSFSCVEARKATSRDALKMERTIVVQAVGLRWVKHTCG